MYNVKCDGKTEVVKAKYADHAALRFVADHYAPADLGAHRLTIVVAPVGFVRQTQVFEIAYSSGVFLVV